jgi:signal transduction histidine kinase
MNHPMDVPPDLARERAALRRIATVATGAASRAEVCALVAKEVGQILGVDTTRMYRYEDGGSATIVADWVRNADGAKIGIRQSVATPIVIEDRLWGNIVAASGRVVPLPPGTTARLGEFIQLVGSAIAIVETRAELAASRARALAAADEERRRFARDLHDGAQQRLVHTIVVLKMARRALQQERDDDAAACIDEALEQAERAIADVRDLSHGVLPRVLTWGGLPAAIEALAARISIPVKIDAPPLGRLDAAIEANAYYVVAEALTNVAKHARARHAAVTARVANSELRIAVEDDGVGMADPDGSGLLGLADRLRSLDGSLRVLSPPGQGTTVVASFPVAHDSGSTATRVLGTRGVPLSRTDGRRLTTQRQEGSPS